MRALLAMARLTWKAAFRYRLIWALSALLVVAAVVLPGIIKHDETATGFTQIVLTYALGSIFALLGAATLWLACGTLARDIEEGQMQMVAVKPVPRWKIWAGRWLGIVTLDAALLLAAGLLVYAQLQWRSRELPPPQRERLRQEVLVARASLKEPPKDLRPLVARAFADWRKQHPGPLSPQDAAAVLKEIEEQFKAADQIVRRDYARAWRLNARGLRERLGDGPLHIRAKLYLPEYRPGVVVEGRWRFGPLEAPLYEHVMPMTPEAFQEFVVPASRVIGEDGTLLIHFVNRNPTAVVFLLEDGLEVLYRESSFEINYARGLLILWMWLALLAALGLAASAFLSFPVAAFFALSLMVVLLFSGSMAAALEEGTVMGRDHETGQVDMPLVDRVMLPVFKGILSVVQLARSFSPIDALSTGRSITWGTLGQAFLQVMMVLGGAFALLGISTFTRRELAAAQLAAT
ncbi:hypothetical protein NXS98_15925 [Fontisphaera persica]|uniref:hypothetical protein n=1 Tax=Fontisphaera persica TaxID=2974023 RepID=UPI0024C0CFE3|nr:hypothetical protein [Fontisphaera persica]WCJ59185.1 hypothetical protein NXS98_15925 [Fontisphaera persica]